MDGQSSVPQVICPTWLTLSRWSHILLTSAQPLFTVNCLTIPPSYLEYVRTMSNLYLIRLGLRPHVSLGSFADSFWGEPEYRDLVQHGHGCAGFSRPLTGCQVRDLSDWVWLGT